MGCVEKDSEGNVTGQAPAATTHGPIPPKAYLDNWLVGAASSKTSRRLRGAVFDEPAGRRLQRPDAGTIRVGVER
jgi:hypothetical protein